MPETLVIIESPGKRKKLEAILGHGYTVKASFGHVRDLPERSLGVDLDTFRPEYTVTDERSKATLASLRAAAAAADTVLLATDPDREGEAIAWHLVDALGLRNAERVAFAEITPKAVKAALAAPRSLDMDLVRAQEARRVLDRLVGYRVSPALSNATGERFSAGRVQSPAVRLVVDREHAIAAFRPLAHFGAELVFDLHGTPWKAVWTPKLPADCDHVLDRTTAELAAGVRALRVASFADTQSKAAPPAPFTTSTLQQRAQVALKLRPKTTMELAQKLYELGAITYMRTDSPNLSDEAFGMIADYAKAQGLPVVNSRRSWKAKGGAQEAHEAIRPTHIDQLDAGDTDAERELYRLIWTRAVASQLADATFAVRTANLIAVDQGAEDLSFVARGRTLIDKGWKALYDEPAEDDETEEENAANQVPALAVDQALQADSGDVLSKTTKAPARFTLATLVRELEANGIGRPATYASILDNIMRRGYIDEGKKGALSATAAGIALIAALVGRFHFADLEYTRELEDELDRIAAGSAAYREVLTQANAVLDGELASLPVMPPAHACPDCGSALRRREGKRGPFWGCSAYPRCSTTLPDADGVPGQRSAHSQAPAAGGQDSPACPDCGKPLRRKVRAKEDDPKGRGWDFWGCSAYPACKHTAKPGPDGLPLIEP